MVNDLQLLNAREVAALLQVSKSTLYLMHRGGLIPPARVLSARRLRWLRSEIEGFILARAEPRRRSAVPERPQAKVVRRPRRAPSPEQPASVGPQAAS